MGERFSFMSSSGFRSSSKEIDGKGVDARFGGNCQLSDICDVSLRRIERLSG